MVAKRKMIDIERMSEPGLLARELEEHSEGLTVREGEKILGVITATSSQPVPRLDDRSLGDATVGRGLSDDEIEELRLALREMSGLIDADAMHVNLEESRRFDLEWQRTHSPRMNGIP